MQLTSAGVDTPIKPCHANLYHGDGEKDDYVMLTMVTKWENWITSIMMEKPEHPWPSKPPGLAPLLSQKPPENCCMCIFLHFFECFYNISMALLVCIAAGNIHCHDWSQMCRFLLNLLRCKGILHELPDGLPEHVLNRDEGALLSIPETFRFTCSGVKMERVPTSSILLLCTFDGRKTCSEPSWRKFGFKIEFAGVGRESLK